MCEEVEFEVELPVAVIESLEKEALSQGITLNELITILLKKQMAREGDGCKID